MSRRFRLGIDIGGTFTDVVIYEEGTGETFHLKVPSSRRHPEKPVIEGANDLVGTQRIKPEEMSAVVHGCTIATNAIIEKSGVKTGLVVTRGFKGLLEIGRFETINPLSLSEDKLAPLVPKGLVKEVRGRILSSGEEIEPLSEEDALQAVRELSEEKVHSIAICLLNSYVNPVHELKVKALIEKTFPTAIVLSGTEIWPEMGEYERAYIAILNGYIKPLMDTYLSDVESGLRNIGIKAPVYVPKLNGGITTVTNSKENPIATVTSGPTAGAQGAAFIAKVLGVPRAISLDLGGTSADFTYIENGVPAYSTDASVGGFPVAMPSVWITSVGAGGGSIAWVDSIGVLKVGPQSAGAEPGPCCYGRGGAEATVTDAYVVCGYLSPRTPFSGGIKIDKELAIEATSKIASKLKVSVLEASEGILRVANAMMAKEISALVSKRGLDPRESSLIAFGGAGPVHAHWLLDELKLKNIVIAPHPGTLSALGGVLSDVREDAIRSICKSVNELNMDDLRNSYEELSERLKQRLKEERVPEERSYVIMSADMKYRRQGFTLNVLISEEMLKGRIEGLKEAFHKNHQMIYKHHDEGAAVEVVNLRVSIIGMLPQGEMQKLPEAESENPKVFRESEMYYKGKKYETNVYRRSDLRNGHFIIGPAIIEQEDTTIVIPSGFSAEVNMYGFLLVARENSDD